MRINEKISNILNNETVDITNNDIIEILNVFKDTFSSENYLKLILLLNKSYIDPNDLLNMICIESVNFENKDNAIIVIGLCLKYGANPNLYINNKYHIISYINEMKMSNIIILILIISGTNLNMTNLNMKSNKDNDNLVKDIDNELLKIIHNVENLDEWIDKNIDQKIISKIATILDKPSLIKEGSELSSSEIIRDHSSKLIHKIKIDSFDLCIKYLNLTSFKHLIKMDLYPSYNVVNDIILLMCRYHETNDMLSYLQLKEMLSYYLLYGGKLDPYQYNMLFTGKIVNSIVSSYNASFNVSDKKGVDIDITDTNEDKNDNLKILAFILNIDPNLDNMEIIHKIKENDKLTIKKAAIKYYYFRTAYGIHTLNDYKTKLNYRIIQNIKPLLDKLENNFNEIDIIYINDDNNLFWVFPNDMIEELLYKKKNVYMNNYTNELIKTNISDDELKNINNQRSMLKRLGLPVVLSIKDLDENEPNIVDFTYTQKIRNIFYNIAHLYNVTAEKIESLNIDQISSMLDAIKSSYYNINLLDINHAHMTFYHIMYKKIKENPDIAQDFFNIIHSL